MGFRRASLQVIFPRDPCPRLTIRRPTGMQSAQLNRLGTIQNYQSHSEAERMSAKAQEVALDRLLVDRFKSGDQSAFDELQRVALLTAWTSLMVLRS